MSEKERLQVLLLHAAKNERKKKKKKKGGPAAGLCGVVPGAIMRERQLSLFSLTHGLK